MSFPERIRYGASELRRFYNRNLFAALGISVAVHLLLIGVYLTSTDTVIAGSDPTPTDVPPWIKLKPTEPEKPNPPVGPRGPRVPTAPAIPNFGPGKPGSPALAGNPKPVDDNLIDTNKETFASVSDIASGTPDGTGKGGSPNGSGTSNEGGGGPQGGGGEAPKVAPTPEDIPSDYNDPAVELPNVDLAALSARAYYPTLARENGIEGKVTVKVLIDEDGRPVRASIEMGSNVILDSAAIQAVRSATFQPATLNGAPVKAWLYLPITFQLN